MGPECTFFESDSSAAAELNSSSIRAVLKRDCMPWVKIDIVTKQCCKVEHILGKVGLIRLTSTAAACTLHIHTVVWCAIGCVISNTYTSVTYLHHLWISKFSLWYRSCQSESILIEKQHFSLKKIKFRKYVRDLFLWNLISKFLYHCVLLVSWGLAIICRCF